MSEPTFEVWNVGPDRRGQRAVHGVRFDVARAIEGVDWSQPRILIRTFRQRGNRGRVVQFLAGEPRIEGWQAFPAASAACEDWRRYLVYHADYGCRVEMFRIKGTYRGFMWGSTEPEPTHFMELPEVPDVPA